MARLVMLQDGQTIPFDLTADETTVGRHPDCGIQIPSNMVSRHHARLVKNGDAFSVEDMGSGNGTFVNGKRIEQLTQLNNTDRVKLGPVLLRFESGEQPAVTGSGAFSGGNVSDVLQGSGIGTLGQTIDVDFMGEEDDESSIVGSIESSNMFGMLNVQPEAKLKAVLEISHSLAGTVDLKSMLPKILDTLFSIFPHTDRGVILLKDEDSGNMIPAVQKYRRDEEDESVKLSRTILQKVLTDKTGILSADAANDDRFEASESISNLTIRSMMCVPLLDLEGEPTGVINLDTQNPLHQFKSDDLDLLQAVAAQAAVSYETARLMNSYIEKQKQDNEMRIASDVQRALLPESLPHVDGYEFYASYDSAQAVGGDYYDCIMLDEDHICVSFGDVAGKGVPGAIIMSRMASVVQNTMAFVHDVEQAVTAINNHMCANAVEGRFVTYVLAVIDLKTHEMTLVNAGHMSPIIRKPDGSITEFDEDTIGLPIGVMEDYPFEVVKHTIAPGEMVVVFTDGVDEAMNPEGELYTMDRLRDFIKNGPGRADEMGKAILADVRKHANGRPQNDDITIMSFGRNPE